MKNLNENELFERLHHRLEDRKISHDEITAPDYEVWGRAREWTYEQAVCLLAGLVPITKPYLDLLIQNESIHLVSWLKYYPTGPKDRTRLQNIDRLLQEILLAAQSKKNGRGIQPHQLLTLCKNVPAIAPFLPTPLVEVVEQLGAHPSLDLPNCFSSLEINPSTMENIQKLKERKSNPLQLNSIHQKNIPASPPLLRSAPESALAVARRLAPLKNIERWQKADTLSLNEIVLLHYRIDPILVYSERMPGESDDGLDELRNYISRYAFGDRQLFVSRLDENKLLDLLYRALDAQTLTSSSLGIHKEEIVRWMQSKQLDFALSIEDPQPDKPRSEENLKQTILDYDTGRFRPEQQGRLVVRIAASSVWKEDKSITLQKIMKHARLKKAIALAQEIMKKAEGLDPKTIEDWIRDLNPNYNPKK